MGNPKSEVQRSWRAATERTVRANGHQRRGDRHERKRIVTLSDSVAVGEASLDKVAVAKRLGVKPKTVAEWANQGKLPAYRIGPYLRFKWVEVEQHLAAACRCVPVAAPQASGPVLKAFRHLTEGTPHPASSHLLPRAEKGISTIEAERERK